MLENINDIDTLIITTNGFSVFKDKQKRELIRLFANREGIIVLTDSDSAGFKIRSFIGSTVDSKDVIHAYIPDIFGKEKRKAEPSKEGKLGVEGMTPEVILQCLRNAGATFEGEQPTEKALQLTKLDLVYMGLSGGTNSKTKRLKLLKLLQNILI